MGGKCCIARGHFVCAEVVHGAIADWQLHLPGDGGDAIGFAWSGHGVARFSSQTGHASVAEQLSEVTAMTVITHLLPACLHAMPHRQVSMCTYPSTHTPSHASRPVSLCLVQGPSRPWCQGAMQDLHGTMPAVARHMPQCILALSTDPSTMPCCLCYHFFISDLAAALTGGDVGGVD